MDLILFSALIKGVGTLCAVLLVYTSPEAMAIFVIFGGLFLAAPDLIALAISQVGAVVSSATIWQTITSWGGWSAIQAGWSTVTSTLAGWMWWRTPPPPPLVV